LHKQRSCSQFEIKDSVAEATWKLISAVLWLGNITYKNNKDGLSIIDGPAADEALNSAASLLGFEPKVLLSGVRTKVIHIKNETTVMELNKDKAKDSTDALAKALHMGFFDWTVKKLNDCLFVDKYTLRNFIGVLDIFGFEHFKFNSLEQFLINFANEKLQKFFNHHIFSMEQEEYEKEKINWQNITFKDNQECLDLIEKRPVGILSYLDEECKFPQSTEQSFVDKLNHNLVKHENYEKPKIAKLTFFVVHYAGKVEYDVTGWLEKNRDELPEHLMQILRSCPNKFVADLFPLEAPKEESASGHAIPAGKGKQAKTGKLTLSAQFKNSLQSLTDLMHSTSPFFVRCIKPNPQKVCNNFVVDEVQAQLRYAGMLETIRIRRLGYPIRYVFQEFYQRYKCLVLSVHHNKGDFAQRVKSMIPHVPNMDAAQFQIGLTKVFLKQGLANTLEDMRTKKLSQVSVICQKWWRMIRLRRKFLAMRKSALRIQTWYRYRRARRRYRKMRWAAIRIQAFYRMIRAIRLKKKLAEEKKRKEEARRKKLEEERAKRIAKGELEEILKEEAEQKAREMEELQGYKKGAKKKERKLKKDQKEKEKEKEKADAGPAPEIVLDTTIYVAPRSSLVLKYEPGTDASNCLKIIDLDLTSVVTDKSGQILDVAYYNNLKTLDEGIILNRDDRVGQAEKDGVNEKQTIELSKLVAVSRFILVLITCYSDGYTLKDPKSVTLELVDESNGSVTWSSKLADIVKSSNERKPNCFLAAILVKSGERWIVKPVEKVSTGMHWLDVVPLLHKALVEERFVPKQETSVEVVLPRAFRAIKGEEIVIPPSVSKLLCGLGWIGNEDLDLAALTFRHKEFIDHIDPVRHKVSKDGALLHKGDAKTGKGTDDERIFIDLASINKKITTVIFVATIFNGESGGFSKVKNAHIRLVDASSHQSIHDEGKEIVRYALSSSCGNRTAQIMCKLYRNGPSRWNVLAMGEPSSGAFYEHLISRMTPFLDPAPVFKTMKVTILDGKNLPSDPKFVPIFKVKFDRDSQKSKPGKEKKSSKKESDKDKKRWKESLIVSGEGKLIEVAVYSHSKVHSDKFIGQVMVPVDHDFKKKWFPLEDRGKKKDKVAEGAELLLTLQDITGTEEAAKSADEIQNVDSKKKGIKGVSK